MADKQIINLRRAGRGTDGSTAMPGATRARFVGNLVQKRSQAGGQEMQAGAWKTAGAPQVVIEFEGFADALAAIKGTLTGQTLVLGYVRADGNRAYTVKWCTATGVRESTFPPAEEAGSVVRHEVTFDVHKGDNVTTLAEAMTEGADAGSPSGTLDPIVMIQAAYRGAAGTTAIDQAVRAILRAEMVPKTSWAGGSELPDKVWVTSMRPQIVVESEDSTLHLTGITGAVADEIVKINYQAGSGNRILTAEIARLVDVGELAIEPAELAGNVSRYELIWDLIIGTGVTGIDDALTDAAA